MTRGSTAQNCSGADNKNASCTDNGCCVEDHKPRESTYKKHLGARHTRRYDEYSREIKTCGSGTKCKLRWADPHAHNKATGESQEVKLKQPHCVASSAYSTANALCRRGHTLLAHGITKCIGCK